MVTAINSRDVFLQGAAIRTSKDFLSMEEKPSLISDYSVILNTQTSLGTTATSYGITTEKIAYDNAISTLTAFLATLTTPVAWNDLSNITFVVRATLTTNIANVYTAEKNLRTILLAKQSIVADLSVPNISMPADSSNVVSAPVLAASGGVFKIQAGVTDITTGNGIVYSVVGTPVGCTVTINASTGVYVPTAITADNATATLRATLTATYGSMVIDKVFNLSRVKSGINGKAMTLMTDSLAFKIDKALAVSPASINLTVVGSNLAAGSTAVFSVTSGTAALSGTGDTRNLTYANMATNAVTISVTKDGLTDVVTLVKLLDGIDTINGILTNESHTLTADVNGVVSVYTGAVCSLNIIRGITNDNANWSFTKADSTGLTSSIVSNTVTITNITSGTASGYVDITATRTGFSSIVKRFTVSKSLQGSVGNSSFTATVYYQGGTVPSGAITGGSYNFTNGTLTPPTGAGVTWVAVQPASSTVPTYSTEFTFTGLPTATVTGGNWSTSKLEAVNGLNGEYRDIIQLYGFTTTKPSVTTYYNFNTNTISSSNVSQVAVTNWSLDQPSATAGNPVYVITQLAKTTTPTVNVSMLPNASWTNPAIVSQVGAAGNSAFTATVYYQGGTVPSTSPTGGSYNFSNNTLTVPTGGGAGVTWSTSQPATTTTPTYACDFTFTGAPTATISGGTWTVPRVEAVNGTPGSNGEYRDIIQLYGFTTTRPTATTYYNFSTNSISASNSSQVSITNWSMNQPTPTVGNPVYVITQLAKTTTPTINVDMLPGVMWSTPVVVSQVGSTGSPGTQGLSYVTAYVASSVASTATVPTQSTGVTAGNYQTTVPAFGTGGLGSVTWQKTVPTLSANQYMYQTDGIYDPVAGTITWSIPYWSSLKVGSLSTITQETGNLTVTGNIDAGTGTTSWHVDSLGNMWSGAASFGAAPFSVTSAGVGKFNGSVQVGSAAISGTTMTGSGAQFNSSGTFALGAPTSNFVYNGTEVYLNGTVKIPSGLSFSATTNIFASIGYGGFAVFGTNNNNGGTAVYGSAGGTSGVGVKGSGSSSGSYGVHGECNTGIGVFGYTLSGKAIYGTSLSTGHSGYFSGGKVGLTSGTSIELNGAQGAKGQVLQSEGSGNTPIWGKGMDSGATSTDASGNATLTVKNMQSSSFGISGTTTSGCFLVIMAGPTPTVNPNEYTIPVQTQFTTTGAAAANLPIRWVAIG